MTKEISQQIDILREKIAQLKEQLPYQAVVFSVDFPEMSDEIVLIEDNTDHEYYAHGLFASDSLESLLEFCVSCQCQFSVSSKGTETHKYEYNKKTNTYTAIAV